MCSAADFSELPDDPNNRSTDHFASWLEEISTAANEDSLFEILASKRPPTSKLARQQIRGRLVKLLGEKFHEFESGHAAARTADAWLQEGGDLDLQGQDFIVDEVEPWGSTVAGADVLDETEALIDAYVFASPEKRDALTLWNAYTHVYDCFGISPLMDVSSPTKRCGKTTAVVIARNLCRAPLLSGNITPAALFRAVEAWKPTLLIDEADTFAKMNDELRGILNAGHTRDTAFVVRAVGDSHEPRLFSTWSPKLVAAIGRLPDTIEDRAIRVVLSRKPVGVTKRDAFDPEAVRRDCEPIRRRLARFALDDLDAIAMAEVERPDGLNDRAWNNWRPLFAVAAAAAGDWPDRARAAALALSGDAEYADQEDFGTLVLQHVWEALEPAGRLATSEILEHLVSKDEGPWAKWWESPIARGEFKSPSARLARLLRPFGITPEQIWIDGKNVRGYSADAFRTEAVAVYLRTDARDASDARNGSSSGALSSDPSEASELSEVAPESIPLIGDEGYLQHLYAALEAEIITEHEWHAADHAHRLVRRSVATHDR